MLLFVIRGKKVYKGNMANKTDTKQYKRKMTAAQVAANFMCDESESELDDDSDFGSSDVETEESSSDSEVAESTSTDNAGNVSRQKNSS